MKIADQKEIATAGKKGIERSKSNKTKDQMQHATLMVMLSVIIPAWSEDSGKLKAMRNSKKNTNRCPGQTSGKESADNELLMQPRGKWGDNQALRGCRKKAITELSRTTGLVGCNGHETEPVIF